jgi:trehalose 6-phosphate phosphatase
MHWQDAVETLLPPFLAEQRIGVISDVDGTISPIVANPDDAAVLPTSKAHLTAIQPNLALLAFMSGRGAMDICERVGIDNALYVGNHGMERVQTDGTVLVDTRVTRFRANLEAALNEVRGRVLDGMTVEDKGATASVHYRNAANPRQIEAELLPEIEKIASRHHIVLHSGKMVFELRPPVPINKGTAFAALVKHYNLGAALYLGDDVTDADAMQAAQKMRQDGTCYALAVGVAHDGTTPEAVGRYSDFLADGVEGLAAFLGWLADALSASRT